MKKKERDFRNPFPRPWMTDSGAAAAAAAMGFKGAVAGGISGAVEICITYPTEYVKTQLQLDEKGERKKYKGIIDCVVKTVKYHGITGLYRGLAVLVLGGVPKVGVRFSTFELLKNLMQKYGTGDTPASKLFCGMGAGVSEAIFVVTPMETIKTKFVNDQRSKKREFKGFFHGIATIIRRDGIGGIYMGALPTVLKQGSNQAIRFYVIESLKDAYKGGDSTVRVPTPIVGVFGLIAGAASVFGNTPMDVVKTRMQGLEASMYKGTVDCIVKIMKNEGPFAFYKGTLPRLCRVTMDVGITFMVYDYIMELFDKVWPS